MVNEAVVGAPLSSFSRSTIFTAGAHVNRMSTALRKARSAVPCPAWNPILASRLPAAFVKIWTIAYSSSNPERSRCIGRLRYITTSRKRAATWPGVSTFFGLTRFELVERCRRGRAFGLLAESGDVMPAAL